MPRRVLAIASLASVLVLSGCGLLQREERAAWRAEAEKVCLAAGHLKSSPAIRQLDAIDGPSICGMDYPLRVEALDEGRLTFDKPVTMDCPMAEAMEAWLLTIVQPAAQARFGADVAEVDLFGAYSCRSVDNLAGARLSEHAFGNAVDISGFGLSDGRKIVIVRDWRQLDTPEGGFLRDIQAGACGLFTTVLAPGSDAFHYNHFHLDLARHGMTPDGPRHICRPEAQIPMSYAEPRRLATPFDTQD